MTEEKQIAIQNLEKYIKEDVIYNGSRENLSNFDEFCINHCLDIQIVLDLVKEKQKEIENSVSKDKIREIFEKINQCKIRTDGKVNAKNYMIFGETERAYGWFINLDYIEKILLDRKGYNIGE